MDSIKLFFFLGPIVFGIVSFFRGSYYRKNVINKRRLIKIQVISSVWVSFIFSCIVFYEDFKMDEKIFYQGFFFNILLTFSFLLILKQFKDEKLF